MKRWQLHLKASRLVGRREFAAAGSLYEQVLTTNPADWVTMLMLASCYEQQNRLPEALRVAEEVIRLQPDLLMALQSAVRVSVALDQHDKATEYVRRALALPEVRNEIPAHATPRVLLLLLRGLANLPGAKRRFRVEELPDLEPGSQALVLHAWKRWAEEYLVWRGSGEPSQSSTAVH